MKAAISFQINQLSRTLLQETTPGTPRTGQVRPPACRTSLGGLTQPAALHASASAGPDNPQASRQTRGVTSTKGVPKSSDTRGWRPIDTAPGRRAGEPPQATASLLPGALAQPTLQPPREGLRAWDPNPPAAAAPAQGRLPGSMARGSARPPSLGPRAAPGGRRLRPGLRGRARRAGPELRAVLGPARPWRGLGRRAEALRWEVFSEGARRPTRVYRDQTGVSPAGVAGAHWLMLWAFPEARWGVRENDGGHLAAKTGTTIVWKAKERGVGEPCRTCPN